MATIRTGRVNLDSGLQSGLFDTMAENLLSSRRAANISQADKKYALFHRYFID